MRRAVSLLIARSRFCASMRRTDDEQSERFDTFKSVVGATLHVDFTNILSVD